MFAHAHDPAAMYVDATLQKFMAAIRNSTFFKETYQCTHTGIYHILTHQGKLPIHAGTPSAIFGCLAAMARVFRTSRSNLLVFLVACGCLRLSRVFVATNWRLGCYAEC